MQRNGKGWVTVGSAKSIEMAVVYFKKRVEHRATQKSRGRWKQVDYILSRRSNLKETEHCKVASGEIVASKHQMIFCRMTLKIKKRK